MSNNNEYPEPNNPTQMDRRTFLRLCTHSIGATILSGFSDPSSPQITDLDIFKHKIETSPAWSNIMELQRTINSYRDYDSQPLDEYLKTSDWYQDYPYYRYSLSQFPPKVKEHMKLQYHPSDLDVDHILTVVNRTKIEGQRIQCVGYTQLIATLYPELKIQNIGGATLYTDEKRQLLAKDLIPPILRDSTYGIRKSSTNLGCYAYGGDIPINFYRDGDVFVIKDCLEHPYGHVGIVVTTHTDKNGKVSILCTDANRNMDGIVHTYIVHEENLEEILGKQRFILAKDNR